MTASVPGKAREATQQLHRRHTQLQSAAEAGLPGKDAAPTLGPVLVCVAVACMGAFAFGYHLGVVNGPLEAICSDLGVAGNKALAGLIVSSTLAGAAVGSLGGGGLADQLGRRKSFFLCALPMLVGPLLSGFATSINTMVAGRFLAGVAIGLSSAVVPTYISEVAPANVRGSLGSLNQLLICFGILAALVVNVVLPPTDWRTMFLVAAAPAVLLFIGMLFSPESPRFLAQQGKRQEALDAATSLWGPGGANELGEQPAQTGGPTREAGWSDLFAPGYRRGAWIGITLFAFQQFSGINALIYFSSSVFKQAGVTSTALASAAVGVVNVLGTLIAAVCIERAGRTDLLKLSYIGMAVTMTVMAAGLGLPALASVSAPIALGGTLLYILAFAVGAGPVTGLVVPELNAAKIRGRAVAAAMVSHWVCNVVIGQTFMAAVDKVGVSGVYLFFAAACVLGVFYISASVPETKGKTLGQIEAEMAA